MRIGRSRGRRYCTNSGAPAPTPKISTDIWPMLPPFFTGEQNVPNFGPNFVPVIFGPSYFWTGALYRKTKTNLSRTDDRSTIIPNLEWVGPRTPRTVGAMGTPKGKSAKVLIYPTFQRPRPSIAPPMLYHLSLIHIWRCRRIERCRSRWSPYH